MVNIQKQIISIAGSVNLKSEKLLIKQHIWANQSLPVHSIKNLCFAWQIIITSLKNISVFIHEQTCFKVGMCFNRTVDCASKSLKINPFVKFQQIRNVVNGCSHICSTFNKDTFLRIGKRVNLLNLSLCFFSCSFNKALQSLDRRIVLDI